jgi:Protein of unknown function (DUF3467)
MTEARRTAQGAKAANDIQLSTIPRRQVGEFATYYVNNAGVSSAFYDLAIVFSEIQAGPNEPVILEKCRVTMSPAHGKALALALMENIKRWESQFGEIGLPPGMVTVSDAGLERAHSKQMRPKKAR